MFSYTNRKGAAYFLHAGKTKTGKIRYAMKRSSADALNELPDGYEVVENVNARVYVRKIKPRQISHLEEKLVRTALQRYGLDEYRVEIKSKQITVFGPLFDSSEITQTFNNILTGGPHAMRLPLDKLLREEFGDEFVDRYVQRRLDQHRQSIQERQQYSPVFRFCLVNRKSRTFAAERMCYLGEGGWLFLAETSLPQAVDR